MRRPLRDVLGATLLATLLAVLVTWPQTLHLNTAVARHHDAFFSVWRLGWVAHALSSSPSHLFDANIFYPATGTLTYSDAMLLEGVLGAPLLWAGVSHTLAYNTLLFVGFVGSGVAMFVLARYLTGATGPALVAAAAFTLAPYRIEHVMHLELQWVMFVPLAFWAFHRAIDAGSWRFGALAGLCVWLQIISCVYYGVFLVILLVAFVPLLLLVKRHETTRVAPVLAAAALVAGILTLPYAWPYIHTARTLGGRDIADVIRYSARPIHYLAAAPFNRLWGWTGDRWGAPELSLFPGLVVTVLAVAGAATRSRRWLVLYAVTLLVAVELSFGIHGTVYRWMFDHVGLLQGLRASARFALLATCALCALAALGAQAITARFPRWRTPAIALIIGVMAIEGSNRPLPLTNEIPVEAAPIYKVINSAGPGVVIELPLPTLDRLPGREPYYLLWSMWHWHPLVNGYSGYYPPDYVRTLVRMPTFPDDLSIAQLHTLNVRYLVVHRDLFEPETYTTLMLRMATRPELKSWGMYQDPVGNAALFVVER